jgi:hypothetical protein
MSANNIEWMSEPFIIFFNTIGPTVLITRRSIMRYEFNKCFLYAAYLLILPNSKLPTHPPPPLSPRW